MPETFPSTVSAPFCDRQRELWDWIDALAPGYDAPPYVGIWSRGGGKCLDADTLVLLADGRRCRIADIHVDQPILSLNELTGKIEPDVISNKWVSGVAECVRIKTRTGKSVALTHDHKVLTFDGWKRAGDIALSDRIASPRRTPTNATEKHTDQEVRLLAYMMAEGGTSGKGTLFTNMDEPVVTDFTACAEAMGFSVRKNTSAYGYYLGGASPWIKRMGLRGCLAINKRVPEWVFALPDHQKWQFLAAFVDTDGWIEADRGRLGIALANEALISDLVYLWASVGVVTSVYAKENGHAGAWSVMADQECLALCAQKLPLKLKGDKLAEAMQTKRYSLIDTYPREVCLGLPSGLNRRIRNATGLKLGSKCDVTRGKLRSAIACEPLPEWERLEAADVLWDKVKSVEEVGRRQTFDVEVANNHNLITDLLITHNSSTVEMGVARVCAKLSRRFALYICGTQDSAEDHVSTVGTRLESLGVERAVNKYGSSKGWSGQQLRTANGFSVRGIGLDTAARGVKIDDYRPDFIILDDIDSQEDSLEATKKKIRLITCSLLPTGSTDAAILFVQNLIHSNSIAAQLADGRADFLLDRLPVKIHPAVIDLKTEAVPRPNNSPLYRITGGTPTWEGQNIEVCQRQINKWGIDAFLVEAQHEVRVPGSLFFTEFQGIDYGSKGIDGRHIVPATDIDPEWTFFAGMDGGWYNPFNLELMALTPEGNARVIGEIYESRVITTDQAKHVKQLFLSLGIEPSRVIIYADPSMWNQKALPDGTTRAEVEDFWAEGLTVVKANNDRYNGWSNYRKWLAKDGAFAIMKGRAPHLDRTMKTAVFSRTKAEDLDDDADVAPGHMDPPSSVRYGLMQYLMPAENSSAEDDFIAARNKRRKATSTPPGGWA